MAKAAKKAATKSGSAGKRTTIAPNGDKRYVRRDENGQFTENVDQGKSLSIDKKKKAKTIVKPGQGDRGDQAKKGAAPAKKAASKKAATQKK